MLRVDLVGASAIYHAVVLGICDSWFWGRYTLQLPTEFTPFPTLGFRPRVQVDRDKGLKPIRKLSHII